MTKTQRAKYQWGVFYKYFSVLAFWSFKMDSVKIKANYKTEENLNLRKNPKSSLYNYVRNAKLSTSTFISLFKTYQNIF